MSVDRADQGLGQSGSEALPAPYPWCLACGSQHSPDTHCSGCNGDHSAGYCMTDELAAELAKVGELRDRVTREANRLFTRALHMVRQEGGQ